MSWYERLRCSQTEIGRGLITSSNDYYLLGTNYILVEGTIFINVNIHFCCHPISVAEMGFHDALPRDRVPLPPREELCGDN